MPPFTNEQAYAYASQWGSFMTNGDPGACMYGFSDDFTVQSETHRADCIAWMQRGRANVEAAPGDYEANELEMIDSLIAKLTIAHITGATPFDSLDEFEQEYAKTILFDGVEIGDDPDSDGDRTTDLDPANLSADACADIKLDCKRFREEAGDLITQAEATGYDSTAYDFWMDRNGAGVGFWDRTELEADGLGDKLSEVAKKFGEAYAYQGDDGFIYLG